MIECPTCRKQLGDEVATCPDDGTPLPRSLVGQVLGERYRITRTLGEGGMGQVYLAEHVILGKQVAVKVLRGEFSRNPDLVKRFQLEAVAASQIGQENIVDVTDFGRTPEGSFYFVMEYISGASLASLIDQGGAMAPARALPMMLQVSRALAAAHSRGIVHRDLKPDNVIVARRDDGSDLVKVLDFGISKVGEGLGGSRLTQVGMVVGTPHYMSPEQATGETVDARADIYAFGVLLYELLTGTLPFHAETALAILMKHQSEPPPTMHARRPDLLLDEGLERLVQKLMAKHREDRPQTMVEVGQEIARCLTMFGFTPAFTPLPMPAAALAAPLRLQSQVLASLAGATGAEPSSPPSPAATDPRAPAPPAMPVPAAAIADTAPSPRPRAPTEQALSSAELAGIRRSRGPALAVALLLLLLFGTGLYLFTRKDVPPAPVVEPVALSAPPPPVTPRPKLEVPAPPIAAPPAAPLVKRVALRSVPRGALVFGAKGKLGMTPLELEVTEGQSASVELRAAGYHPRSAVVHASDAVVEVHLTRLTSHAVKHPAHSAHEADPYGKVDDLKTANPYAN